MPPLSSAATLTTQATIPAETTPKAFSALALSLQGSVNGSVDGSVDTVSEIPAARVYRNDVSSRNIVSRSIFAEKPVYAPEIAQALVNLREFPVTNLKARTQSPQAFVAELAEQSLLHRAVNHPYLEAMGSGALPDTRWALADFGQQYQCYSKDFPRYLTAVISRLADPGHRAGLMENLSEESGIYEAEELAELSEIGIKSEWIVGKPHPQLFNRFCKAMGLEDQDLSSEPDQIICWREMLISLLSSGTPAEAVGALGLGTENIVSTIYKPFSRAVAMLPELAAKDTVFFPLHTAVDDHHQETLQGIAADLAVNDATRSELRRGMLKALSLRSVFWDWMYRRALDPQNADKAL
jgi:pyrroloquinoline quinone (PQQ) biosynthesis protein C